MAEPRYAGGWQSAAAGARGPGSRRGAIPLDEALVAALSELEDLPVELLRRHVELTAVDGLPIELDPAVSQQPPGLRARDPEVLCDQRGQVHHGVRGKLGLLDVVRHAVLHVQTVEV